MTFAIASAVGAGEGSVHGSEDVFRVCDFALEQRMSSFALLCLPGSHMTDAHTFHPRFRMVASLVLTPLSSVRFCSSSFSSLLPHFAYLTDPRLFLSPHLYRVSRLHVTHNLSPHHSNRRDLVHRLFLLLMARRPHDSLPHGHCCYQRSPANDWCYRAACVTIGEP